MAVTEEKMEKIRRLEKLHRVKVGERVTLRYRAEMRSEEVDSLNIRELRGVVHQLYEHFVVIKTSFGTHPSYNWMDFDRWRVE